MSLRALHRISCTIIPSACGCKTMSIAQYCTPATKRLAMPARKIKLSDGASSVRMLSTGPEPGKVEENQPLTFKEKVSNMWKNYGKLAIGTYIGVYISTLGSIFFALDFDVFNAATFGFDHAAAIAKVCDIYEAVSGRTDLPLYMKEHPTVGTFAVAWVMTKFTEPLRLATTVVIVPPIARYWDKLMASKAGDDAE